MWIFLQLKMGAGGGVAFRDWNNADGGDTLFSTGGNWFGGVAPIDGDTVNFNDDSVGPPTGGYLAGGNTISVTISSAWTQDLSDFVGANVTVNTLEIGSGNTITIDRDYSIVMWLAGIAIPNGVLATWTGAVIVSTPGELRIAEDLTLTGALSIGPTSSLTFTGTSKTLTTPAGISLGGTITATGATTAATIGTATPILVTQSIVFIDGGAGKLQIEGGVDANGLNITWSNITSSNILTLNVAGDFDLGGG